jgi:hypothetical protein
MSYKIAGIDVHKKVLMVVVVVMDASTPDEKPERRRFANPAERIAPTNRSGYGSRGGRSGDGIDGSILAVVVVGVGAVHAFASGPSVPEPCSRGASMSLRMPSGWCGG